MLRHGSIISNSIPEFSNIWRHCKSEHRSGILSVSMRFQWEHMSSQELRPKKLPPMQQETVMNRRENSSHLTRAPFVPWEKLEPKLKKDWTPGEHVTLIGPTGSGKTHMALALARICKYSLIIATKRRDPLLESLQKRHLVISEPKEVQDMARTI